MDSNLLLTIFMLAMVANGITVAAVWGLIKLQQDEVRGRKHDPWAIGCILGASVVLIVTGLAITQ